MLKNVSYVTTFSTTFLHIICSWSELCILDIKTNFKYTNNNNNCQNFFFALYFLQFLNII